MNRVWVAPLGTPLDGPGWTDIGSADFGHGRDDGLTIIDDLPQTRPPLRWPITITLTTAGPSFGWWRLYRDLFGITHPRASRVKRAYHQRRR